METRRMYNEGEDISVTRVGDGILIYIIPNLVGSAVKPATMERLRRGIGMVWVIGGEVWYHGVQDVDVLRDVIVGILFNNLYEPEFIETISKTSWRDDLDQVTKLDMYERTININLNLPKPTRNVQMVFTVNF